MRAVKGRSLAELADAYLGDLELRSKPRTVSTARSALLVLMRTFREVPSVDDLESWRRERVKAGTANRTVNRDLTTLGACLRFAVKRGWIKANPVPELTKLPTRGRWRRRVARALPDSEVARMIATGRKLDAHKPKLFPRTPLLQALFLTGARWHELVQTTWGDLDTDRATLSFREDTTKTSRCRTIPLDPDLFEVILSLRAHHVRVTGDVPRAGSRIFLRPRGTPWSHDTSGFHVWLSEVLRAAGIPKPTRLGVSSTLTPRATR